MGSTNPTPIINHPPLPKLLKLIKSLIAEPLKKSNTIVTTFHDLLYTCGGPGMGKVMKWPSNEEWVVSYHYPIYNIQSFNQSPCDRQHSTLELESNRGLLYSFHPTPKYGKRICFVLVHLHGILL